MAEQVEGLEGSQPVDLTKHPTGIVPTHQNIVSTVNPECKFDLKAIALRARNAEYNPKVCTGAKSENDSKLAARKHEPELFPDLIYSMKQPMIVLLVFVSGKIVLTGAKVRDEIYTAFENI